MRYDAIFQNSGRTIANHLVVDSLSETALPRYEIEMDKSGLVIGQDHKLQKIRPTEENDGAFQPGLKLPPHIAVPLLDLKEGTLTAIFDSQIKDFIEPVVSKSADMKDIVKMANSQLSRHGLWAKSARIIGPEDYLFFAEPDFVGVFPNRNGLIGLAITNMWGLCRIKVEA